MFRFLVVDDEPAILRALCRTMQGAGHVVETADSVEEAIAVGDARSFDLAIVDHHLGTGDGMKVLQHLRTRQPNCLRILLSGSLDLPTVIEAVNEGKVLRVLHKPFAPADMLALVEDALDAQQRSRALAESEHQREQRSQREELVTCLTGDQVQLALQPIVDPSGGAFAFEALLRSSHATLSNPKLVLEAAEAQDMVQDVADVVARRALGWLEDMSPQSRLFINLHPYELADTQRFVKRLDALASWASRIVLEITERTKLADVKDWRAAIAEAKARSYAVAVDDLGAGYNSLSTMAELAPEFVKIDMSLVRSVHQERQKEMVVGMLCTLAHATNARVIAEGVECAEEATTLVACGADYLQGYWFGKPSTERSVLTARVKRAA